MLGRNQSLDDRAPLELIHHGESEIAVAAAARLNRYSSRLIKRQLLNA